MSERRYSVAEIDELRRVIELRWLYGTSNMTPVTRLYMAHEEDAEAVEALVRTHMLAGHTAKDIYDADKPKPAQVNAEKSREPT